MTATMTRPAAPPLPHRNGLRKMVSDSATLASRNLIHIVREPGEPIIALLVPIIMALMFGYVFGNALAVTGEDYREFLMPGIFVMAMLYGLGGVGTGVALDADRAVMARFRSLPMSSAALFAGRVSADLLRAVVEIVLVVACGLLVGWTFHNGVGDALLAVGLILLFRVAMICLGILLGLVAPNPDAVPMMIYPLAFPLSVVSTTFLPPSEMPGWLGTAAEWNPVSSVVSAVRELFGNPGVGGGSWVADNAMLMAVVWPVAIIVVCVPLAVRRYRRMSH